MQIKDTGIIVSKRLSGEKSAIITVFTKEHGLYPCYIKNISGKNSVTYQLGNIIDLFLSARLDEHIATGKCELVFGASHFMQNRTKLYALNSLLAMIVASFEEKVPHLSFFTSLSWYVKNTAGAFVIMDYFRLESEILSEAGYGLDLSACAVTGSRESLIYVSPKSGRAVSQQAGQEYKDKLLPLPPCALRKGGDVVKEELLQMSDLLLYFFKRYVFKRGQPNARQEFVKYLKSLSVA